MSKSDEKIEALAELNIIPVSVSYEWESCDVLKALEIYESREKKYVKKPGEDLNSILTGIVQPKGRVHIEFCPQITIDDLSIYNSCTNNEYHKKVAELIDSRINAGFKLTPNNYIAHDLRYGQKKYIDKYTEEELNAFIQNMHSLDKYEVDEKDILKDIFLGIYSNPLKNK